MRAAPLCRALSSSDTVASAHVDQDDSPQGFPVAHAPGKSDAASGVWARNLSDGSIAVALYNEHDSPQSMGVDFASLGWKASTRAKVRDLWAHSDNGTVTGALPSTTVAPHATIVVRLTPVQQHAASSVGGAESAAAASPLADWMARMEPIIANRSLLDLSLPGSHDTMTYDLSTAMSDGYEGLPSIVTTILHALTPLVAGQFIRDQGRTQGLNITAQLDSGVRFIDFRIMLTSPPPPAEQPDASKDWFCLHGCQTNHPALEYLLRPISMSTYPHSF